MNTLSDSLVRCLARDAFENEAHAQTACVKAAAASVAAELVAERTIAAADADMFVKGFTGWSAKFVAPRDSGQEGVFRAGRAARKEGVIVKRINTAALGKRATMSQWVGRDKSRGIGDNDYTN